MWTFVWLLNAISVKARFPDPNFEISNFRRRISKSSEFRIRISKSNFEIFPKSENFEKLHFEIQKKISKFFFSKFLFSKFRISFFFQTLIRNFEKKISKFFFWISKFRNFELPRYSKLFLPIKFLEMSTL